MRPVSNYLIYIHIALCAAARLPYNKWKFIIQFSFENFIANFADELTFFFGQNACIKICNGRSFF